MPGGTLLASIGAFAVIALAAAVMPGADTILVLRSSLRDGTRAGVVTALGIATGTIIWGTLAGLGVALIIGRHPLLYTVIAAAGGLYLGYLAVRAFLSAGRTWRAASEVTALSGPESAAVPEQHPRSHFTNGLVTNLLNPKLGALYMSVMPGLFIGQAITAWLGALLGSNHAVIGVAFLSAVAALSGLARRYLMRPKVQAVVEAVCGLCLLAFGVFVLVEAVGR